MHPSLLQKAEHHSNSNLPKWSWW